MFAIILRETRRLNDLYDLYIIIIILYYIFRDVDRDEHRISYIDFEIKSTFLTVYPLRTRWMDQIFLR